MLPFILDNAIWVFLATASLAGMIWTVKRDGVLSLSAQAAIIKVSRQGGVYLDIRPAADYEAGHIPLSRHIPADQIDNRISSIDKIGKKPIVVICDRGMTSKKTVKKLQDKGYDQVYWLAGGMALWKNESLPIIKKNKKGSTK